MLFLATDPMADAAAAGALGGLIALFIGMALVFGLVGILVWIYQSIAYMAIAKKDKQESPGLAWIPGVGPIIIAYKAAKMPFWPWWLVIGSAVLFLLSAIVPILSLIFMPLIGIAGLVFAVYVIIWHWKLFEEIGKPGWWAILLLIPAVNLIIIGIAAWSKE